MDLRISDKTLHSITLVEYLFETVAGYIQSVHVAPSNFIEHCTAFRRTIDVGGDSYMQTALAALIREGELTRHLKKAKKYYHKRRDFLDKLLIEKLHGYISYVLPTGGMAVWIQLYSHIPVTSLVSNPRFYIKYWDSTENGFRLGFASMNEEELTQIVDALKEVLQKDFKPIL